MCGVRLQRHNGANCLCNSSQEHTPWLLEAEYTPKLAKALATAILEAIANGYELKKNVVQFSKKLKLSHFHALASAKQPCKSLNMQMVPDFFTVFGTFQCAARDFTSGTRLSTGHVSVSLVPWTMV
jgi:hypothetical protein